MGDDKLVVPKEQGPRRRAIDPKQKQHLPLSVLLEETEGSTLVFRAVIFICILVTLGILWAGLADIDEIAVTSGEIIPGGKIPVVQHLEGGMVTQVLVRNGEEVKAGQLLIKLDHTGAALDLAKTRSRQMALALDAKRLDAFAKDQNAHFANGQQSQASDKHAFETLYQDDVKLLQLENASRQDSRAILLAQLQQQKEELMRVNAQIKIQKQQIVLYHEELAMYEALHRKNLVSGRDFIRVKREANKAQGKLLEQQAGQRKAKAVLDETRWRLQELDSALKKTALENMGNINSELLEVSQSAKKLKDRMQRTHIRSPVDGVVKGLTVTVGKVIAPGEVLMEVVPTDEEMFAQIRIKPRDIGHIQPSDPVKVKVTTFNVSRYGAIPGELVSISASSFFDAQQETYYQALVKLDLQNWGKHKKAPKLIPGMTLKADVITGKKTLLQYLLKPLREISGGAFHER